jgi:putative PIN family toxin of toxin-antitoxin system
VYKVVLDTNVLISAIVFGGKPREILNRIIKGQIQFAISKDILNEMEGVLSGRKFQYPEQVIQVIRKAVEELGEFVIPKKKVKKIVKDPDDNKILECALAAEADLIISGDIHLLELKQYKNIQIVSPSEYLKKYKK